MKNDKKKGQTGITILIILGIIILIGALIGVGIFLVGNTGTQSVISHRTALEECEHRRDTSTLDNCFGCAEVDVGLLNCIIDGAEEEGIADHTRIGRLKTEDIGEFAYVCYDNDEVDDNSRGSIALQVITECIEENIVESGCTSDFDCDSGEVCESNECVPDGSCPTDIFECEDGSFVSRDINNNCNFAECQEQEIDNILFQIGIAVAGILLLGTGFIVYRIWSAR